MNLAKAMGLVLIAGLILTCAEARAATTVTLTWTNPSTNTDGTALTNLADIIVTYGPCSADHTYVDGSRGTPADFVIVTSVAGAAMKQVETIPGKGDTCFVAVAQNTVGLMSAQSNVAVWTSPLPTLGRPAQLSNIIHFNLGAHRGQERPAQRLRNPGPVAGAPIHRSPDRVLRANSAHA